MCEGNFGPVWRHDPNEIMRREYGEDWGERVLGIGSRSENGATSSSGDDGQQQQQQPLIRGFQESRPPVPGTGAAEDAVEEWRRQAEWRFRVMCKGEEEKGRARERERERERTGCGTDNTAGGSEGSNETASRGREGGEDGGWEGGRGEREDRTETKDNDDNTPTRRSFFQEVIAGNGGK